MCVGSLLLRARAAGALVLLLALVLGAAREARAAGTADEALAESLFTSGKTLMNERRWDEACAKFDAVRKLSPGIGVTMWLAECHEKAGRLATAWLYFREAATSARTRSDDRAALADTRAKKLEPRLARVRIVAGGFRGEVFRDEVKLPEGAIGEAMPVDPGKYRYRFVEAGRPDREAIIHVTEEGRTYDVSPPEAAAAPSIPSATPPTRQAPAPSEPAKSRVLGYVLLGVAAAGIGVGSGFGLDAAAKRDRSNEGHCTGNVCDAEGIGLRDRAFESATLSTVAFVVGAGALVASAAVFLGVFDSAPRRAGTTAVLRW